MFFVYPSLTFAEDSKTIGKVIWVKGGAFSAISQDKIERPLQKDSPIYLNDTLITDDHAQAQIVFTDNSLMTFRQKTQFRIDQYQYQPKKENEKQKSVGKYVMSLIEGGFRTITGLIAKNNPDDYKINTPVATIGVRGTDYTVYVHQGQMFMGYYQGTPCVTSGGSSLCLSDKTRFTHVPAPQAVPIPVNKMPIVFKEKLPVVPAVITQAPSPAPTPTAAETPKESISNQQAEPSSNESPDMTKQSEPAEPADEAVKETTEENISTTDAQAPKNETKEITNDTGSLTSGQKEGTVSNFCIQ